MSVVQPLHERIRNGRPRGAEPADVQSRRERVLRAMLPAAVLAGAVAYTVNVIPAVRDGQWALAGIYTAAYVWILAITMAKRLPYAVRAYGVLFLMYALGEAALAAFGLEGGARLWLLSVPVLAGLLLGLAAGLWALGLSALALAAGVSLYAAGLLPAPLAPLSGPGSLGAWLFTGAVFLLLPLMVWVSLAILNRGSRAGLKKERALIGALEHERAELRGRTRDLERRLEQIRSAADVSRAFGGVLDPEALPHLAVQLIHKRAELSFVAVYLLEPRPPGDVGPVGGDGRTDAPLNDPASGAERLYLAAAAGKAADPRPGSGNPGAQGSWESGAEGTGDLPLGGAGARHLPIDETSPVGRAVVRREADITRPEALESREVDDAGGPASRSNRRAPRSVVALPLLYREQVLGALAVYSRRPDAFDPDDVAVLQGVADGLAVALENARLFQDVQSSLEEIRLLHRQHLAGTWAERGGGGSLSYTFEAAGAPADLGVQAETSVPLLLRQREIGHITLETSRAAWSPDELALIEGVAAQAALALENARLVEETQRRARHDRLAAEIAAKVRASTDVETIVRTAVSELGRALNASAGSIRLGTER